MDHSILTNTLWAIALFGGAVLVIYIVKRNRERRELQKAGQPPILDLLNGYFRGDGANDLGERVREIANQHLLDDAQLHSLIGAAFECATDEKLAALKVENETKLVSLLKGLQKEFALSDSKIAEAVEQMGWSEISLVFQKYAHGEISADQVAQFARGICNRLHLSNDTLRSSVIGRLRIIIDGMCHEVMTKDNEKKAVALISVLQQEFALTDADVRAFIERIAKVSILRDLNDGITHSIPVEGLSIVLLKHESVLWVFNNVALYQLKKQTSYVGGSQGVSLRVMRGVSYHVGAFQGHRVQTENLEFEENGSFIVTDHNVYFSGNKNSLRIPLHKIVSVHGYSDGIGLVRESVNPKPLTFLLDDPWFASNLILKLGAMSPDTQQPIKRNAG